MLNEREKLAALSREARRRGMTYGAMMAGLTREEVRKIYRAYERQLRREGACPGSLKEKE